MDSEQIIEQLMQQLAEQIALNQSLTATIHGYEKTIEELQMIIVGLQATIQEQQETIQELRRQLGQNSSNSSKPPSSDGYRKPNPKSLHRKSGKKPGGQIGHAGSHMEIPHEPDEVKRHVPETCKTCPHLAECMQAASVFACNEKRYVVDVVVTTKVTEHQAMTVSSCPYGKGTLAGAFPTDVKAYVQYGDSVSVLAGLLSTFGAMSAMRIHDLMGSLMGVKLSAGTITSMVSKCAQKVGKTLEQIREKIAGGEVGHFDETGVRVGGKLHWVHNSSTPELTYQSVSEKRGKEGMDANGVLPKFGGVAMHDCWASYWKYDGVSHAICNAHLLRELTGMEDNEPSHTWASEFKSLLMDMKRAKEEAIENGEMELSAQQLGQFSQEYDRIMDLADTQCPELEVRRENTRGRKKKGKERSLIECLVKFKGAVCLFIHDFKVPFDNNQAERDVRHVKTKAKVSGCFRTEQGAQNYLDVMSYLGTGRKHNMSVFDALTAAFAGKAHIVLG